MKCSWKPVAYSRVDLDKHNITVGAAVYIIFGKRLEALYLLSKPLEHYTGLNNVLQRASVLAAILHDIGKASPYYAYKENFLGHEAVGAIIIQRAGKLLLRKGMYRTALLLELASWAIARHHAAMKNRHPFQWDNDYLKITAEALDRLKKEPDCLSAALPKILRGGKLENLLRLAVNETHKNIVREVKTNLTKLPSTWPAIVSNRWLAYVSIITGILIVADIIVASNEGRETDEKAGKAYLKWWEKEIGKELLTKVKSLISNTSEAEKLVQGVLDTVEDTLRGI